MNREIKFRAWQKWHEYMFTPDYIDFINGNVIIGEHDGDSRYEDIPLMQYTGLKDKNGKEIYEGDIIEKHFEKYEVLFHNCEWVFTKLKDYYKEQFYKLNFFDDENFEIVGNIYENPEFTQSSE